MKFLANQITGKSIWAEALKRLIMDRFAVVSVLVFAIYVIVGIGVYAGLIVPDWKAEIGASHADSSFSQGWKYWLGLDIFGRSIAAKAIAGVKTALYVGTASSVLSIGIGVFLGAMAGYFGGWLDDVITWLCTVISNIPEIMLLVAIAMALGKGMGSVIVALGMTSWIGMARVIRAEFIRHKNRDYVSAAAAIGASHGRRIWVHIFPNVLHMVIIGFSLRFVTAIKSEVVLTYLGLGAETGAASWGLLIEDAKGEMSSGYWGSLAGATIGMFFIVLAVSIFADSLRDAFDPKLKT